MIMTNYMYDDKYIEVVPLAEETLVHKYFMVNLYL
jgi:hypothetical protein